MFDSGILLQLILLIQTLIFAFILFSFRHISSSSNKMLAAYMLVAFLQFLLSAFELFRYYPGAIFGYYITIPLMLCNAPLLYLYVQYLTNPNSKIKAAYLLHLIPTCILLIFNLIDFGQISIDTKYNILLQAHQPIPAVDTVYFSYYLKVYYFVSHYFYNIQILFYGGLMIFQLNKHRKRISAIFSYKEDISLHWLLVFVLAFLFISFYELIFYNYSSQLYLIILNLYFAFLGFFGLKQTDIYFGTLKTSGLHSNLNSVAQKEPLVEHLNIDELLDNEPLKGKMMESQIQEYKRILDEFVEKEKPFLLAKLNLQDLSEMTGIQRNTLSMVINEGYQKNFFNYINGLRVMEAQKRLLDPAYDNYSIEGLAKDVGFNSKSVFNPAFKKYSGKTPLEFKKAHRPVE